MELRQLLPGQRIDGERFGYDNMLFTLREIAFDRSQNFRGRKTLAVVQHHSIELLAGQFRQQALNGIGLSITGAAKDDEMTVHGIPERPVGGVAAPVMAEQDVFRDFYRQ